MTDWSSATPDWFWLAWSILHVVVPPMGYATGEVLWRRGVDLPGRWKPWRETGGLVRRIPQWRRRSFLAGQVRHLLALALGLGVILQAGARLGPTLCVCLVMLAYRCYEDTLSGQRNAVRDHLRKERERRNVARRIRGGSAVQEGQEVRPLSGEPAGAFATPGLPPCQPATMLSSTD